MNINLSSLQPDRLIKVVKAYEGVTTKELAKKIGISYATISSVEGRRAECGAKLYVNLIANYDLNLAEFQDQVKEFNAQVKQG